MIGVALIAAALVAGDGDANWPGFLGGGPVSIAPQSLPLAWSPERNVAWKAELPGYGQSSPVVWGDKVFLTSVEGPQKDRCLVLAFDLKSGERLWKHAFDSTDPVKSSLYISRAAPTCVTDGRRFMLFLKAVTWSRSRSTAKSSGADRCRPIMASSRTNSVWLPRPCW